MGLMCQQGKHVSQDQEQALEHFKKAAAMNNQEAQDLLVMQGVHYEQSVYSKETQASALYQTQHVNEEIKHYLSKGEKAESVFLPQSSVLGQSHAQQLNIKLFKK